jgi:WD40 repeat protein
VERILNDVGEEPGNLPLLEFALSELWAHRSGRRLTNDAYTASGGVAGAIAQRAEAELERLKPDEREAARELFTGLVRVTRPGEGGRDTGRRGRLDDLGETAKRVAAKLAGRESRLLITGLDEQGKSVVEVAHEALIQSWGQLRRWLDLDREFLLWRDRLRTYRSENQRTGTLLTGPPLTEAERWLNERRQHLNPSEVALIDDSIGARDATLLAQRRRRRWAALGGFGVAGLIALLGFDALRSGFKAARQAEVARAGSILAAQAAVEDPTVSALVLVELGAHGAPLPGNPLAAVRLAQATAVSPIARTILRGHQDVVWSAAFSPDGTRVVTASYDGTARVWRSDGSGRPIVLRGHTGSVRCAAFSPDGSRVVTASADRTARIWDANGLGNPIVLRGHTEELTGAAFSPNGSRVVTASADGTARLWDADGSGRYVVLKHGGAVRCASFSHDGSHLVTASDDGAARVWNAEGLGTPVILRTADSANYAVRDAAFSADGSRVVTASEDGTARVWQTDGVGTPVILRGHQGAVLHAAFSPDGSRVVTASRDRTARIWKADDSAAPIVLRGHLAAVEDATFERDGARVVTASEDGTAAIWKADGSGLPIVLRGHEGEVLQANLSPDGARVVTVSRDHTARIWNPGGTGEPVVLRGHTDIVLKAAFSRDGSQNAHCSQRTQRTVAERHLQSGRCSHPHRLCRWDGSDLAPRRSQQARGVPTRVARGECEL